MIGDEDISALADLLVRRYKEELVKPFPYKDCRDILRETGDRFEALIPDLDMYFYDIADPCCAARRLVRLPVEELMIDQKRLQRSFYDKHPQYQSLKVRITPVKSPDLYAQMTLHDEIRITLLRLLSLLIERHSEHSQSGQEDS